MTIEKPDLEDLLAPFSTLGVGSIPFQEGKNSCEEIFTDWDIPFWPQYPLRSLKENFIFQFLSTFPGLEIAGEKASFDEAEYLRLQNNYRERLERAYRDDDFLFFEAPSDSALGYSQLKSLLTEGRFPEKRVVKLQVTGFNTVWESFFSSRVLKKTAEGVRENLQLTLTAAGLAQIQRVKSYDRLPMIFIDEPVESKNLSALKSMMDSFKKTGAWVGVHVCSSSNWEGFDDLGMHLFHFDLAAHAGLHSAHQNFLRNFVRNKNWIAWGIIPTSSEVHWRSQDFSIFLWDCIEKLSTLDLPAEEIMKHSLISSSCGTGTLKLEQDQAVSYYIRESWKALQDRLRQKKIKIA